MGCPALGKQLSLPFPLCHQMIAPSRGEGNRQITQRKTEPPIFTHVGLWLDAGLQKGTPRDGEAGLLVHSAPSSPLRKHKDDGAENCQSRTFPRLLTTQVCTLCGSWAAGPAQPPVPCTRTCGQMVDSGCLRHHLPASGFPPLVTTADTDILRIVHTGSAFVLASRYLALA